MGDFADSVLELNGGVINPEVMVQSLFHIAKDAFAG